MSRSYVPPPDTVVGAQFLGRLFEHQMHMVQIFSTAMLVANPLLNRRVAQGPVFGS